MSDNWIGIIPRNPHFVPAKEAIARAEQYMAELAPRADEISSEISDTIEFRDCGGNFESVRCPQCDDEISTDWWGDRMDDAQSPEGGFKLVPLRLPCGHEAASLNDLKYAFEQGFSRFILNAMNPNIGELEPDQILQLETILGCPIKVIYQHI